MSLKSVKFKIFIAFIQHCYMRVGPSVLIPSMNSNQHQEGPCVLTNTSCLHLPKLPPGLKGTTLATGKFL